MLAVAIPVRLRAKKLAETIAFRGKFSGARTFDVVSASRTQRSHVREFVSEVQTKNSNLPRKRRGTEKDFATTDAHR